MTNGGTPQLVCSTLVVGGTVLSLVWDMFDVGKVPNGTV